ncbi:MAG: hypothetical protein D6814_15350 [Calditrichaeota bacterium]|nr:MAG: hypothetical protein D6814_15350 [Calditrichota bacterium]
MARFAGSWNGPVKNKNHVFEANFFVAAPAVDVAVSACELESRIAFMIEEQFSPCILGVALGAGFNRPGTRELAGVNIFMAAGTTCFGKNKISHPLSSPGDAYFVAVCTCDSLMGANQRKAGA